MSRNSSSSNPRSRVNSYSYFLAITSAQCNATVLSVCRNGLYSKHTQNTWMPHDTIRHGTCKECLSKTTTINVHGSPGEWAMPRSVEEMLDGLRQRVDVPAPAGTAHNGLPQKKTGRGFPLNRRSGPLDDTAGQWTVLNRHRVASRDL